MKTKAKKKIFYILFVLIALIVMAGLFATVINSHVQESTKERIVFDMKEASDPIPEDVLAALKELDPQCIIILGCSVKPDGSPSDMLRDRLDAGIALYNVGIAPKILLTGDNGQVEYNETGAMLTYCLEAGVPDEDILCDHEGFSTNESITRAANVFSVERAVIVTQRFHEYRSLYIAGKTGIDALGVSSPKEKYNNQPRQEMREFLARNKDFLLFNFGKPTS